MSPKIRISKIRKTKKNYKSIWVNPKKLLVPYPNPQNSQIWAENFKKRGSKRRGLSLNVGLSSQKAEIFGSYLRRNCSTCFNFLEDCCFNLHLLLLISIFKKDFWGFWQKLKLKLTWFLKSVSFEAWKSGNNWTFWHHSRQKSNDKFLS